MFLFNHQSPAETNPYDESDYPEESREEVSQKHVASESVASSDPSLLLIWPDADGKDMIHHTDRLGYIESGNGE